MMVLLKSFKTEEKQKGRAPSLFSGNKRRWNYLLAAFVYCFLSFFYSVPMAASVSIGVRGGVTSQANKPIFSEKGLAGLTENLKEKGFDCAFFLGGGFGAGLFSMNGQFYMGYNAAKNAMKRLLKQNSEGKTTEYSVSTDVDFANKYNFGIEFLPGVKFGSLAVYGIAGLNIQTLKISGSIQEEAGTDTAILSYGPEKKTINGMDFQELKQSNKFFSAFDLGAGVRFSFSKKFFLGLEFRHSISREKKLKEKCLIYDPTRLFGYSMNTPTVQSLEEVDIKVKGGRSSIDLVLGMNFL